MNENDSSIDKTSLETQKQPNKQFCWFASVRRRGWRTVEFEDDTRKVVLVDDMRVSKCVGLSSTLRAVPKGVNLENQLVKP